MFPIVLLLLIVSPVLTFKHEAALVSGELKLTRNVALEIYFNYLNVFEAEKYEIFYTNLGKIIEHNSNPLKTFTMNINKFAFISDEDFLTNYLGAQNCSATA